MALWGATAGVATLVGPLVGGLLVDGPGWEWIFFINVPIGVVGFVLAWRLVPTAARPTATRSTWSAWRCRSIGMFLLVFGIQEGETYDWGTITGFLSVPLLIGSGVVVLGRLHLLAGPHASEPLVPLALFRDRNFSLANVGITTVGFSITGDGVPVDALRPGWCAASPTKSALLLVPMAVLSGALAPVVGRLSTRCTRATSRPPDCSSARSPCSG